MCPLPSSKDSICRFLPFLKSEEVKIYRGHQSGYIGPVTFVEWIQAKKFKTMDSVIGSVKSIYKEDEKRYLQFKPNVMNDDGLVWILHRN